MKDVYSNYEELVTESDHEILVNCDLYRFTAFYKSIGINCVIYDVVASKRETFSHLYQIELCHAASHQGKTVTRHLEVSTIS